MFLDGQERPQIMQDMWNIDLYENALKAVLGHQDTFFYLTVVVCMCKVLYNVIQNKTKASV